MARRIRSVAKMINSLTKGHKKNKKTRQGEGRGTKFSHKKGARYKKKPRGQGKS